MTGSKLLRMTRVLLRDKKDETTTPPSCRMSDAQILRALTAARDSVVRGFLESKSALFGRDSMSHNKWKSLGMNRIALGRLLKTAPAEEGMDVPPDFWRLECGINDQNRYIPPEDIHTGKAFADQGVDQVFVSGGQFHGTAAIAYYWSEPTDPIQDDDTDLGYFADSVYHAIRLLAVMFLLQGERASSRPTYAYLQQLFIRRIVSYR